MNMDDDADITQQPASGYEGSHIPELTRTEEYTANTSTPEHVEVDSTDHVPTNAARATSHTEHSPGPASTNAQSQSRRIPLKRPRRLKGRQNQSTMLLNYILAFLEYIILQLMESEKCASLELVDRREAWAACQNATMEERAAAAQFQARATSKVRRPPHQCGAP